MMLTGFYISETCGTPPEEVRPLCGVAIHKAESQAGHE